MLTGSLRTLFTAISLLVAAILPPGTARLAGQGIATRNAPAAPKSAFSEKPFAVRFTDVATSAGIGMKLIFGSDESKKYIIEANGTGAAMVDYDGDGWLDIFLVNGSTFAGFPKGKEPTSRLYRNSRDGKFSDATAASGVGRSGWGTSVCAGDYDNDGHTDLYVTYWGTNSLYHNDGGEKFTDVAAKSGVAGPPKEWSSGCTFVDYDRDGLLDLFVTEYQKFDLANAPVPGKGANCEWKGMAVFCGPRGLPYGGVRLYRNKGDGTFEDVSQKSGVSTPKDFYAFTAVAADFNRDGWTDIYVACDSTPNLYFVNNGDGTFSDFATETGLAFSEHGFEQGGMGIGVGDFNRDGWLDMVKTNFAGDYPNVYQNTGDGIFEDVVVRAGMAVNPQFVGWGVELVDLDNDGWQDVLQVNGHVYPELDRQEQVREAYRQPGVVYRNLGDAKFEDVTSLVGAPLTGKKSSRGAAFGDFDNDGDVDVVVLNMGEPTSLLRNDQTAGNHWIGVKLQGAKSNRDAIGATVTVKAGGVAQTAAVLSQSSYISHNDLRAHFGLGKSAKVEGFTVLWPSGGKEDFSGAAAGQFVLLVEGSGAAKPLVAKK